MVAFYEIYQNYLASNVSDKLKQVGNEGLSKNELDRKSFKNCLKLGFSIYSKTSLLALN